MAHNYWQKKVKIGNLEVPRFIGGPVDGVTDAPYRRLIRDFSPEPLLYSEIQHVRSVCHSSGQVRPLHFSQQERPLNFQVTANTITGVEQACKAIVAQGVDAVDLNIGCPARNVTRSGSGSALMADVPMLKQIITTMRQMLSVPLTVKMRSGYKNSNAFDVVQLLQDCGIDAIAIHPRLQKEKFSGTPNYDLVAQIKDRVSIPILLSGGIVDWDTAKKAYEYTGVDGFLIARGLWGKPWKLQELLSASMGTSYVVDYRMQIATALKHFAYMRTYYGDRAVYIFRKHVSEYLKGMPHASTLVKKFMATESADTACKLLREYEAFVG